MIVVTVKIGTKETEDGEFAESIAVIARDTVAGEVTSGGFFGSKDTILKIIKSLEPNPEIRVKYE